MFYQYSPKTVSKGRANYLLKKVFIFNNERRPPSKYEADFKEFIECKGIVSIKTKITLTKRKNTKEIDLP